MGKLNFIVALLAASISLAGCGGSDNSSQAQSYTITDNAILKYIGGEELEYNFSYYSIYSDGSGELSANGTETIYIYSGFSSVEINRELYKQISVIDSGALSDSVNDFYFYDDNNNFIHYLTGNDNYYTNPDSPSSGIQLIPGKLIAGSSWTNSPLVIVYEGNNYSGTRTFTIIKKEVVNVPFGNVEAYKINYSGSFGTGFSAITITGTVWIHPKIGLIKTIENVQRPAGLFFTFDAFIETELVKLNWPIE